jgi:hypothetical protein
MLAGKGNFKRGSFNLGIIFIMQADPIPKKSFRDFYGQSAVMQTDPHGPRFADFF